jgi:6-phosphofructokinase 1
MVKEALGYKFHWAVADYLQRAARHLASESDVEQAYALGKAAVEKAIEGKNSIMPTVVRESSSPYKWSIGEAPLSEVANVEKMMPNDFISADGYGITDKCREYLYPLIQGEAYPPYKANGLPDYVTLKLNGVARRLPDFEL